MAAGHQLVAGQSVPLASFPAGDYRLEMKVQDNISKKSVTRNINFTVRLVTAHSEPERPMSRLQTPISAALRGSSHSCRRRHVVRGSPSSRQPRSATASAGSIQGTVLDDSGSPLGGATVSAFGATMAFAVTDAPVSFCSESLPPGPYLVRAHLSGFAASTREVVDVYVERPRDSPYAASSGRP